MNCLQKRNTLQKEELPSEKELLAGKGIEELLTEKGIVFRKKNRLQKKKSRNSLQKKKLPSEKGIPLKKRNSGIPSRKKESPFKKGNSLHEKELL